MTCVPLLALGAAAPNAAHAQNAPEPPQREAMFFEAGLGLDEDTHDAYTDRLEQFGFREDGDDRDTTGKSLIASARLGWMFTDHIGALIRYDGLEHRTYHRDLSGPSGSDRDDTFEWSARALSVGARGRWPLVHEWLALYTELDVGWARTRTIMSGEDLHHTERFNGLFLAGRGGLDVHASRRFGFFVEAGYSYAPALDNLVGDTHDAGGTAVSTGIRVRSLEVDHD